MNEDLDELERLHREATPGPTRAELLDEGYAGQHWEVLGPTVKDGGTRIPVIAECGLEADAALIVWLRNHAGAIAAELRRLRGVHEMDAGVCEEFARLRELEAAVREEIDAVTAWRLHDCENHPDEEWDHCPQSDRVKQATTTVHRLLGITEMHALPCRAAREVKP